SDQFSRVGLQATFIPAGPSIVDPKITALTPSQLLQALFERCQPCLHFGIARVKYRQYAEPPHPLLLRARRKIEEIWPVRTQSTGGDEEARGIDRRQPVLGSEPNNKLAMSDRQRAPGHD